MGDVQARYLWALVYVWDFEGNNQLVNEQNKCCSSISSGSLEGATMIFMPDALIPFF